MALGALAIAHAILQWADLWTTYLALSNGGIEANPISAAILDSGGWAAYAAIKSAIAVVFIALAPAMRSFGRMEARFTGWMLGGFAVMMLFVVVNNARIAA